MPSKPGVSLEYVAGLESENFRLRKAVYGKGQPAMTLYIYGDGGHAKVVRVSAQLRGDMPWDFDEDVDPDGNEVYVAIGDNITQHNVSNNLEDEGWEIAHPLIDPKSDCRGAHYGLGSFIAAGAIVQPGASIGEGAIINTGATVDHDCVIDQFAHIAPGAHLAGNVKVGLRAWIGIGACVKQGITIGEDAIVGAGAVVVEDVPPGVTAFGNPCRPQNKAEGVDPAGEEEGGGGGGLVDKQKEFEAIVAGDVLNGGCMTCAELRLELHEAACLIKNYLYEEARHEADSPIATARQRLYRWLGREEK